MSQEPLRIFFDLEFTGLHQKTTPISIGCVCDNDASTFYAEFTDYDPSQVNPWLQKNVISKLRLKHTGWNEGAFAGAHQIRGSAKIVARNLHAWLYYLRMGHPDFPIQMWGDVCAYDWVLFRQLLQDHTVGMPDWIYYIPFDISTLMLVKGVDPDIDRGEYIGVEHGATNHNALQDAAAIHLCWLKLMGRDI